MRRGEGRSPKTGESKFCWVWVPPAQKMILVKGDLRKQRDVLGGCAGTPKPWAGMLDSVSSMGTLWKGSAGMPKFQPGMLGTASSLGHCLIPRVFPLFPVVLSP